VSFRVQTQGYSGPFDLLLQLVTRKKVAIGAISISEVADQYLEEVNRMGDLDLDVASDFVLVASTLLDIKAASLVPEEPVRVQDPDDLDDTGLEDLDPAQAREVLIARLIAYKQIRNAAAALSSRMEAESRMLPRTAGPDPEFLGLMPDYTKGITISSLAVICADLDSRHEHFLLEAEHIAPKRISLALVMASVDRFTRSRGHCSFDELLEGSKDPEKVVATFLAMLTLYHRGSITVRQEENFAPIEISRVEGAPAYDPAADLDEFEEDS
jgi:segregation and condensation protein A